MPKQVRGNNSWTRLWKATDKLRDLLDQIGNLGEQAEYSIPDNFPNGGTSRFENKIVAIEEKAKKIGEQANAVLDTLYKELQRDTGPYGR